jgi:hypothetical protein
MAAILLGSGCLYEQFYRGRYHQQQHCLWFSGSFQDFDRLLSRWCIDTMILLQIIQGL